MQMLQSDLEQLLHSPTFQRESHLYNKYDWLIYPEDKVICSLVDGGIQFPYLQGIRSELKMLSSKYKTNL